MSRSSRRRLLLGGASAVLGVTSVAAAASPADAAGPAPLLLGRGNSAGTRGTGLTVSTARTAWALLQRGAGLGMTVTSAATAVLGAASLGAAWGVHGRNTATSTGTGGALRGEGRRNAGLLADTTVQNVPAVVAIGGDGTGVAQVATGQSYLDGDALALRAWTGVLDTDGVRVAYAPVVSAESALHTTAGTVTLDAAGAASVGLPTTFTAGCDMTTLTVVLTPVGAAMPALFVTYRQNAGAAPGLFDGFTVTGGTSSGSVAWTACAARAHVDLQHAAAAAVASPASGTGPVGGPAGPGGVPAPARPRRLTRPALHLPAR
ncbi:MAG TPA: hypothetical protein VMT69_02005 [Kineosporiaceae bacterium]|nr:hypothetical protein [Kineosporiaceae bacterium]